MSFCGRQDGGYGGGGPGRLSRNAGGLPFNYSCEPPPTAGLAFARTASILLPSDASAVPISTASVANTSAASLPDSPNSSPTTNTSALIGGIVGGVSIILIIIILALVYLFRRRRCRRLHNDSSDDSPPLTSLGPPPAMMFPPRNNTAPSRDSFHQNTFSMGSLHGVQSASVPGRSLLTTLPSPSANRKSRENFARSQDHLARQKSPSPMPSPNIAKAGIPNHPMTLHLSSASMGGFDFDLPPTPGTPAAGATGSVAPILSEGFNHSPSGTESFDTNISSMRNLVTDKREGGVGEGQRGILHSKRASSGVFPDI